MALLVDSVCEREHINVDVWLENGETPSCRECGAATKRLYSSSAAVIGDDIPGGMLIKHGICNEDGTPRRYYSKSEMAKEAARRGLRQKVEHISSPGTDKNKHTQRFV